LRTYFNHLLVSRYGFSNKEASSFIGDSPEVNSRHYDPISPTVIREKTGGLPLSEMIGLGGTTFINRHSFGTRAHDKTSRASRDKL